MALLPGAGQGPTFLHRGAQPLSDINVTPLVDVLLVLLVIFMITAPLITAGVEVDLPRSQARQLRSDQKPLLISIDAHGQIYLGDAPVADEAFGQTLRDLASAAGDPASVRVFLRADRSLHYGAVMERVAEIGAAGFTRVAFLSAPRDVPAGETNEATAAP